MLPRHYLLIFVPIVLFALLVGSVISSQTDATRVLVERQSLEVLATGMFPKDLACEIHVGPKTSPYFVTTGGNERIEMALIRTPDVGGPSVSLVRRDTDKPSYFLHLLFDDKNGKVVSLFDLNVDGQWDVKKTTKDGTIIYMEGKWVNVDEINSLMAIKPVATKGDKRFEFDGMWQPFNK